MKLIKKVLTISIILSLLLTIPFTTQASQEEEQWLPLRALFEEIGANVTWQSEDRTIHVDLGLHNFVYLTRQTTVNVNGISTALQQGIVLQEGLSFIAISDFMLTIEFLEMNRLALRQTPSEAALVFTTGLFGQGTTEQNAEVAGILGEDAEHEFGVYFFWYNTVHEVGHAIVAFNGAEPMHMVDEEILVNEFAIAYWLHYGEEDKLDELQTIVSYALENVVRPVPEGVSHIEYGREMIATGNQDFFTFNNYGWFQFNMVNDALQRRRALRDVLEEMGVTDIQPQSQKTFAYPVLDEDAIVSIIADSLNTMSEWSAVIPNSAYLVRDNNPGEHNLQIISATSAARHRELGKLRTILNTAG